MATREDNFEDVAQFARVIQRNVYGGRPGEHPRIEEGLLMTANIRCGLCGTIGTPRVAGLTEKFFIVMLLLCGVVPGLLAMVLVNQWYPCCRSCGSKMLLPLDSPRAQLWEREIERGGVDDVGADDANQ